MNRVMQFEPLTRVIQFEFLIGMMEVLNLRLGYYSLNSCNKMMQFKPLTRVMQYNP